MQKEIKNNKARKKSGVGRTVAVSKCVETVTVDLEKPRKKEEVAVIVVKVKGNKNKKDNKVMIEIIKKNKVK